MASDSVPFLHVAPFVVDGWRVDPALLQATRPGGAPETLEPKVMGVLCALAARPGDAVARGELFDAVWPDVVVGDDTLTRCVSELRKLFGDAARDPRVIATVPRVGYRLLVPVGPADLARGAARPAAPPVPNPVAGAGELAAPRRWLVAGVAAGLLVAAVALAWTLRPEPAPLAARPFVTTPGYDWFPALSPDGARVAYVHGVDRPDEVRVAPVAGGDPLTLVAGPGFGTSPRWSPDGTRVAYVRQDGDACTIRIVPALGGPEETVAGCPGGETNSLDWWGDGALLVGGHDRGAPGLTRLDLATGRTVPLDYDVPPGTADEDPRVSADGRRALVVRRTGGTVFEVVAVDLETGAVTRLAGPLPAIVGVSWWGDGVVYAQVGVTTGRLMRLAMADGDAEPEALALGGGGIRPDVRGGRLVVERWTVDAGLFGVQPGADPDAGEAALVPFAASTAYDALPAISPDGARVAFLSERGGSLQVWTAARDGARASQATDLDGVAFSVPRWSPDGQRIAFSAVADGDADVFVIDAPGAAPRRVPAPSSTESDPAWSADGAWLTFTSDRSGGLEIWRAPVGGGDAERLTRGGGGLALSDARALYWMRPDGPGVWRRTAGGEAERVVPEVQERSIHSWAPTPGGLVWLEHAAPNELLWRQGRAEPLATLPRGGVVSSLSVGPDGAVLVARVGEREVDLALVDL